VGCLDHDQHALGSARFGLAVLPTNARISVVHSEFRGDGIAQRLHGGDAVVVVRLAANDRNETDDDLSASLSARRAAALCRWRTLQ
jgi:hypothetical protein